MTLGSYLAKYLDGILIAVAIVLLSLLSSYILYLIFRIKILEKIRKYVKNLKETDLIGAGGEAIPIEIKEELDILAKSIKENFKRQVEISTEILSICEK